MVLSKSKMVSRLGVFRYNVSRQLLLIKTSLLLVCIRLVLYLFPFRTVCRFIAKPLTGSQTPPKKDVKLLIWAIETSGRSILGDKACLAQALAGQLLFNQINIQTWLRIGVRKDKDGNLQAHAWLESIDEVLIGGPEAELRQYTMLPDLNGWKV